MNLTQVEEDLRLDEGWVPHAYQDHLGYWTIGYGFLIDERKHGKLPREIGDQWLKFEIVRRHRELRRQIYVYSDAPESVKRALLNMSYQLGIRGLLGFRRMLDCIADRDYVGAAAEALDSRWAEQTPERAERVAKWIAEA